jgi:hypothetical protein
MHPFPDENIERSCGAGSSGNPGMTSGLFRMGWAGKRGLGRAC